MVPHVVELPDIPAGWQVLRHAILSDGALAIVVTDVDLATEWTRILNRGAWTMFSPASRIDQLTARGHARLLTHADGEWVDGPIVPLETPHPLIDRFGDGRWLIVGARAGGEPNARVLAADGMLLARFSLGDGIEHVAIDRLNRIWVGWFDEGVFGNDDWAWPDREWPPSSNGVASFDDQGALIDLPDMPEGAGRVDDCYALTVSGSDSWVLPYSDFPLVRFSPGGAVRWWRPDIAGARAIAADHDHVLIAGGYGETASRAVLVRLGDVGEGEEVEHRATWQMPLRRAPASDKPGSRPWIHADLLTGRDGTMHLVDDGKWYCWRVADALAVLDGRIRL